MTIVNVATTEHYRKGQRRLVEALNRLGYRDGERMFCYGDTLPGWRPHRDRPYEFKARALFDAAQAMKDEDVFVWLDASIVPVQPLDWIEKWAFLNGVWLPENSFRPHENYHWTAARAYPALFPGMEPEAAIEQNKRIPHCATTAFAFSLAHRAGQQFFGGFLRYALDTEAFVGPWINANCPAEMAAHGNPDPDGFRVWECGPADVRGHRHDQTAASVIAWRLGVRLDNSAAFRYRGSETPGTVLVADGSY